MRYITRNELYGLAWSKPIAVLASDFGITGNGLKKICAKFGVPVPQRGYWAMVSAGKEVNKLNLRPREAGAPWLWEFGSSAAYRWPVDPLTELAEPEYPEPIFDEPMESVEARVRNSVGRVRAASSLELAHPEIERLLGKDLKRIAKGREYSSISSYYDPIFASGFEVRRLKLLNGILLGTATFGGKGHVRGEAGREISVKVGEAWVSFTLDHPDAKPDHHGQWHTREGKADTLRLAIKGSQTETWIDQPAQKLEQCLTDILVALALAGEHGLRATALHRRLYSLKRREEMREEIKKRRTEAEAAERQRILSEQLQQRGRLLRLARQARTAADLRAFIRSVEESRLAPVGAVENWSRWANQVADELDPLTKVSTLTEMVGFEE